MFPFENPSLGITFFHWGTSNFSQIFVMIPPQWWDHETHQFATILIHRNPGPKAQKSQWIICHQPDKKVLKSLFVTFFVTCFFAPCKEAGKCGKKAPLVVAPTVHRSAQLNPDAAKSPCHWALPPKSLACGEWLERSQEMTSEVGGSCKKCEKKNNYTHFPATTLASVGLHVLAC